MCVSAGRSSDGGVVFVEGHPITEEEEEKRELVATFLAIVIFPPLLLLGSCGSARARRQSCSDPGLPRHLARRREKRGGGPITEIRCPRKGGGEEEVSSHVAISLLSRACVGRKDGVTFQGRGIEIVERQERHLYSQEVQAAAPSPPFAAAETERIRDPAGEVVRKTLFSFLFFRKWKRGFGWRRTLAAAAANVTKSQVDHASRRRKRGERRRSYHRSIRRQIKIEKMYCSVRWCGKVKGNRSEQGEEKSVLLPPSHTQTCNLK